MNSRFASLFFVGGLVVATGCSGTKSSSGGGGGGPCGAYFDAIASLGERCGAPVASPSRLADFRSKFTTVCANALNAPGASQAASAIQKCADDTAAAQTCEPPDCAPPAGDLADGAACGEDFQCKSGRCQIAKSSSGGGKSQCGTCAARVAVGQPCDLNGSNSCVEGATCVNHDQDHGTCDAKKIAKAGEVCFDPKASGSGSRIECATGLHCPIPDFAGGTAPQPTKCAPPGQSGEPCSSRYECVIGLACVDGKCANGAAEGASCKLGGCAKGLECDPSTNTCAKIAFAANGQPCDDAVTRCDQGTCVGAGVSVDSKGNTKVTPGTCKAPLPDGSACGGASDGGATSSDSSGRCDEFSSCIDGTCQASDPSKCR